MSQGKANSTENLLRRIPQVDRLLGDQRARALLEEHPRGEVLRALRGVIDALRQDLLHDGGNGNAALRERAEPPALIDAAARHLRERARSRYRHVLNASGIILHTGLGRAVLSRAARAAVDEALAGYSLVEVDAATGERNQREAYLAEILGELTGAEWATVVNNNAAATLLLLAALARDREVIISRGQLVEIGGSFRVPDILRESGARLVEVGTTNRTYIDDYRRAITPDTGMLLKVHTSNYEIAGFAHHTALEDLVALGRERGIPVVSDLGSGCLFDVSEHGFRREPLVSESVAAGADLVCFSGDKLLGGPQAGIIVGKREAVRRVRSHPLFRALRVGKMTLAALEATLKLYRDPETLAESMPVVRMITEPASSVKARAEELATRLRSAPSVGVVDVVSSAAQAGSGSLPAQEIASFAVALRHDTIAAEELARRLRTGSPAVFPRVQDDRVLLDLRTIATAEAATLERAVLAALSDS